MFHIKVKSGYCPVSKINHGVIIDVLLADHLCLLLDWVFQEFALGNEQIRN